VKAVVTGGASGLGLAVAQRIVQGGGRVALLDCNRVLAQQVAETLGDHAIAIETDVGDDDSVNAVVQQAHTTFGGLNVAVNCAGILSGEKMLSQDRVMATAEFEQVMAVNVLGTFRVCRAVAQVMQSHAPMASGERGVIVNTASIAAFEGQVGQVAYSASKGAIVSMTLPMARELSRYHIRVFTIAPGVFETPMLAALSEEQRSALAQQMAFPRRLGCVDEFAQMVQQVVENSMLNGAVIRLDGGMRLSTR